MNIKDFADALADVEIPGVYERLQGVPRELDPRRLPSQWVDMPVAEINGALQMSTFDESSAQYIATIYIADSAILEGGLPDDQRERVLDLAAAVEQWAKETTYAVLLTTGARIPVGTREYRGVVARVTANEDID